MQDDPLNIKILVPKFDKNQITFKFWIKYIFSL